VAIFWEGYAGDPPPNICGGSRPGGGCASGTPPPILVLFPPSGRDALAILLQIFVVAVVPGNDATLDLLPPEPRHVALVRETSPEILPQIFTASRSSEGRMRLRYLSRRTSSRGHLQGGGRRRRPSPKYSRWRSSGEDAPPDLLPPEPRRATVAQGQHVPPSLSCRTSSRARGLRPGRGRRRRSSHDAQGKNVQFSCHLWCRTKYLCPSSLTLPPPLPQSAPQRRSVPTGEGTRNQTSATYTMSACRPWRDGF